MTTSRALPWTLAVLTFALPLAAQEASTEATGQNRLTYADTKKPVGWTTAVPKAAIAPDGKHVEFSRDGTTVWFDPVSRQVVEPVPGQVADAATAATFTATIRRNDVVLQKRTVAPGNSGGRTRSDAGPVNQPLTADGAKAGRRREAHSNPQGTKVSCVENGNLVVLDVANKERWDVTTDGSDEMLHGVLDWVYQEEIYGRGDFQGHWWSPEGDLVALLSLDESKVREFTLVDHVPEGFLDEERSVVPHVANYPKVGDPNPRAMLSVVDANARTRVPVDLSAHPADVLVVRVGWTEDQAAMLVVLQDRIQTWAELCAVDPSTGKLTKWIREESKTWVNRPEAPRFLPDGTFLWLSERTGYQHVYHYEQGGKLLGAVTAGEWQVRDIVRVDAAKGLVWFEGTKDGATGRHLYRIGLDGTGLVCLTPGMGTHQFELAPDASFVLDRWSAMDQPPVVRVLSGETGETLLEVGKAERGKAGGHAFVERVRLTIPARDGYPLDATVMLPPFREKGTLAPVHLPTYSGPDAPTVRDTWAPNTYHTFLAHQGFVVLQCNVRSASGRGQAHTGTCYKQLGVQELKDLEDAVAFVCKEYQGDPSRVGIEGWSYGGFMAAYALTHSDTFALGLAGAGVYDWRLYDTIYTERYMALPTDNKAGYDATSVIKSAKELKGWLVLQHGSMDDNVHLQNTMQLLWELQTAGKQNFELMVYPRSEHGPNPRVAGHVRDFQWRALQKLLDPAWKPM